MKLYLWYSGQACKHTVLGNILMLG